MNIKILTERGAELYSAIYGRGDWVGTTELAELTGKNWLSPHDRKLLEKMVHSGILEKRIEAKPGLLGRSKFLFRAI